MSVISGENSRRVNLTLKYKSKPTLQVSLTALLCAIAKQRTDCLQHPLEKKIRDENQTAAIRSAIFHITTNIILQTTYKNYIFLKCIYPNITFLDLAMH